MNREFSILINTTDSFSDCWEPFFKLFCKYWPDYDGKIYLNTETKTFNYKNLNIISVQNGLKNGTWSQCFEYAVKNIDEEYFIYLQEDYFFHNKVDHRKIIYFFDIFKTNKIDCLHLTDQCSEGPFNRTDLSEEIWEFSNNASYRISTQAAFWKKSMLLNVIRSWESGWDFEKFGTKRTINRPFKIMTINHDIYKKNHNELMPYVFTGIIKGKWKKEVVQLFDDHEIRIDYLLRGFSEAKQNNILIHKMQSLYNLIYAHIKNFYMEKKLMLINKSNIL